MINNNHNFSKLVRLARTHGSMTQKEFAKAVGVSLSTIKMWENDIVLPNFDNIKKLIEYLRKMHEYELATMLKNHYIEEKADK